MCLRRCPLLPHRALSADHLQLSEEGILLGSLAISLAVPAAWTWWKNRQVYSKCRSSATKALFCSQQQQHNGHHH